MLLFLVIFLSVYALMHSVIFWGVYPLLRRRKTSMIFTLLFFAAMLFTPIFVRIMEHKGFEQIARIAAWVGFSWLGFVFIGFNLGGFNRLFSLFAFRHDWLVYLNHVNCQHFSQNTFDSSREDGCPIYSKA